MTAPRPGAVRGRPLTADQCMAQHANGPGEDPDICVRRAGHPGLCSNGRHKAANAKWQKESKR
jgi:hypothetical protein